jgi:hypothetical protein
MLTKYRRKNIKGKFANSLFASALTITLIGFAGSTLAQDKPALNPTEDSIFVFGLRGRLTF